jgi:hypothetical protein
VDEEGWGGHGPKTGRSATEELEEEVKGFCHQFQFVISFGTDSECQEVPGSLNIASTLFTCFFVLTGGGGGAHGAAGVGYWLQYCTITEPLTKNSGIKQVALKD